VPALTASANHAIILVSQNVSFCSLIFFCRACTRHRPSRAIFLRRIRKCLLRCIDAAFTQRDYRDIITLNHTKKIERKRESCNKIRVYDNHRHRYTLELFYTFVFLEYSNATTNNNLDIARQSSVLSEFIKSSLSLPEFNWQTDVIRVSSCQILDPIDVIRFPPRIFDAQIEIISI